MRIQEVIFIKLKVKYNQINFTYEMVFNRRDWTIGLFDKDNGKRSILHMSTLAEH